MAETGPDGTAITLFSPYKMGKFSLSHRSDLLLLLLLLFSFDATTDSVYSVQCTVFLNLIGFRDGAREIREGVSVIFMCFLFLIWYNKCIFIEIYGAVLMGDEQGGAGTHD